MRGIYLGIGSNIGDRAAYLALVKKHFKVIAESSIYESPALLPEDAPVTWNKPFLNQVLEIESDLSPEALLLDVKRVEALAGRKDRGRWSPRELDIDILAFGNTRLDTASLQLPHAGISSRDFVLLPLREIAPSWPNIHALIADLPEIRARIWRKRTQLMGILNVTPDSFSDGGTLETEAVASRFEAVVDAGADIIDIGGESTRPNAVPLEHEEEWARINSPLHAIMCHPLRQRVAISVDTRHWKTAKRALELGVDVINDVSGLSDASMIALLKDSLCDIAVMHSLTIPADKNITLPDNADPVAEVLRWKAQILALGIPEQRLVFDCGIGFGKTAEQSRVLIQRFLELKASGGRWLMGHSRKSFLEVPMEQRDAATLAISKRLAAQGVDMVRIHDVAGHYGL
ncbi:MAG: dihydropteroate synthase [Alphaproteobacteria bacterium]|nr:dihydropteroate synthase [Alphaproteobacteria bacterium]